MIIRSLTCTEPKSQTRPMSLRARSTSMTCSARSLGSASNSFSSAESSSGVRPRRRVPAMGRISTRRFSQRTWISGEAPTSEKPSSSSRNMYGEGLRVAVEDEQLVGDQKIHSRRAQVVLRRSWHDGFDVVDEFVADETDRAAGEPGQTGQGHGTILFQNALDHFEAVPDTRGAVSGGPARDHKLLHDVAAFDDLDAIVGLPNDRARVAANEGVTTQMLAAFDRFKKKRFALAANFPIGRQGRFQVSQQTARDRNQVALRREL